MNKKNKLITMFVIIAIILIIVFTVISIIKGSKNKEDIVFANTNEAQRKLINSFLQRNPYISNMNDFGEGLISDTDIVKSAIYSSDVQQEYIVEEDIIENELFVNFEGYKKSIENIKRYSEEIFGQENLELNFVETYYNDSGYLIINDEYVFFSKQEQKEKIYIAVTYEVENNDYEVQIYEYNVTDANREILTKMLETGEIDKAIEMSNKYILTGQIENENIKIWTKTSL